MNEELLYQAQLLKQESEKIQSQLEAIEQQITELSSMSSCLSSFLKSNEKEILASLGKGIHLKTNLTDKDLLIEVGSGVLVKKTPEQTIQIIDDQQKKLKEAKVHLLGQKEICAHVFQETLHELQHQQHESHEHEPKHSHEQEHHEHTRENQPSKSRANNN